MGANGVAVAMSGALVGDDAVALERLAGTPFRPRRSALHATRIDRKFERLDQCFDLNRRAVTTWKRDPLAAVCSLACNGCAQDKSIACQLHAIS